MRQNGPEWQEEVGETDASGWRSMDLSSKLLTLHTFTKATRLVKKIYICKKGINLIVEGLLNIRSRSTLNAL